MARIFLCALALAAAASVAAAAAARDPVTCALVVPDKPLTAAGLATPYILKNVPGANGNCTMADPLYQVFVNAVVLDFAGNRLLSYTPLVIDEKFKDKVPVPPTVPVLPQSSIVAIFIATNFNAFGTVNDKIVLMNADNTTSLFDGNCLTGVLRGDKTDSFLQFATCNSIEFFSQALAAVDAKTLTVPPLATGKDGLTCPTVRSFDLVDSTQSDTVPSSYILLADGSTVQNTPENLGKHPTDNGENQIIFNESDAALLDVLDDALGCTSWKIQDLTDPTGKTMVSNFAADELQAAVYQKWPVALVPADDPDVVSAFDRNPSLTKLNTYRAAVGQKPVNSLAEANRTFYCQALLSVGTKRLDAAKSFMMDKPTHDATMGNNLYTFWAARFNQTFSDPDEGLGCKTVLSMTADPITCTKNNTDPVNPDACLSAAVTVSDPLGVYTTKAVTDNNGGGGSKNGTIIGLSVALALVAAAGVAFFVVIYRRTHGFAALGSGGISLREV